VFLLPPLRTDPLAGLKFYLGDFMEQWDIQNGSVVRVKPRPKKQREEVVTYGRDCDFCYRPGEKPMRHWYSKCYADQLKRLRERK
jgi:hypothetical protein